MDSDPNSGTSGVVFNGGFGQLVLPTGGSSNENNTDDSSSGAGASGGGEGGGSGGGGGGGAPGGASESPEQPAKKSRVQWGKVQQQVGSIAQHSSSQLPKLQALHKNLEEAAADLKVLQRTLVDDRHRRSAAIVNDRLCRTVYTLDMEERFKRDKKRERSLKVLEQLATDADSSTWADVGSSLGPGKDEGDGAHLHGKGKKSKGLAARTAAGESRTHTALAPRCVTFLKRAMQELQLNMPECDCYIGLLQQRGESIRYVASTPGSEMVGRTLYRPTTMATAGMQKLKTQGLEAPVRPQSAVATAPPSAKSARAMKNKKKGGKQELIEEEEESHTDIRNKKDEAYLNQLSGIGAGEGGGISFAVVDSGRHLVAGHRHHPLNRKVKRWGYDAEAELRVDIRARIAKLLSDNPVDEAQVNVQQNRLTAMDRWHPSKREPFVCLPLLSATHGGSKHRGNRGGGGEEEDEMEHFAGMVTRVARCADTRCCTQC
jgi:hypothetical protein